LPENTNGVYYDRWAHQQWSRYRTYSSNNKTKAQFERKSEAQYSLELGIRSTMKL
jgi:hypothetical protein